MRADSPGGRFTIDFELDEIGDGITYDATNPFGTHAEMWIYDLTNSAPDPIYDVEPVGSGRTWLGPYSLHIISASQNMGRVPTSKRGFYSADTIDFIVNIDDLYEVDPSLFLYKSMVQPNIVNMNRNRLVWKGQVYRPVRTQLEGYVDDRGTLLMLNCIQVMPDELVNDAQFQQYAQL